MLLFGNLCLDNHAAPRKSSRSQLGLPGQILVLLPVQTLHIILEQFGTVVIFQYRMLLLKPCSMQWVFTGSVLLLFWK